jgi:DNA-binding PadR family transcriptional regulator
MSLSVRFDMLTYTVLPHERSDQGLTLNIRPGGKADEPAPDPGTLYRTLRTLEEDGLVRSAWETADPGPARRVYEVTDQGIQYLHAWAVSIRGTRAQLGRFLDEYEQQFQRPQVKTT